MSLADTETKVPHGRLASMLTTVAQQIGYKKSYSGTDSMVNSDHKPQTCLESRLYTCCMQPTNGIGQFVSPAWRTWKLIGVRSASLGLSLCRPLPGVAHREVSTWRQPALTQYLSHFGLSVKVIEAPPASGRMASVGFLLGGLTAIAAAKRASPFEFEIWFRRHYSRRANAFLCAGGSK